MNLRKRSWHPLTHRLRIAAILCLSAAHWSCSGATLDPEPGEASALEGALVVYAQDHRGAGGQLHYALRGDDGSEVAVEFSEPPTLPPGTRVRLSGHYARDGVFDAVAYETASSRRGIGSVEQAITQPEVARKAALLMLHFGEPDNSIDRATLQNRLFGHAPPTNLDLGSVTTYYNEVSYGALSFTGDVYDWIQIPRPADPCRTDLTRIAAEQAAQAKGIDLSKYQHVMIYLTAGCGNTPGQAELGTPANPARYSWYYYDHDVANFVHELGHNLGFSHANSYECGLGTVMSTPDHCSSREYGDPFDPMGERFPEAHVSAYNKALQGWLRGCNVVTAPAGGDYALAPLELSTTAPQALRIPMAASLCPAGISPCYYYVEYRQPIGYDGVGQNAFSYMHLGATLRIGGALDPSRNTSGQPTQILSMRPPTADNNINDPYHAQILPGVTFRDPAGTSISVLSKSDQKLMVRVQVPGGVGGGTCLDGTSACSDGQQDGTESDPDCGGTCSACGSGKRCNSETDCLSRSCVNGTCASSPLTASLSLPSRWNTGYCAEIQVRNTGTQPISNWRVRFSMGTSQLTNSWLGQFTALGSSRYEITPFSWNQTIAPGQFVATGYCASWTGSTEPKLISATMP